MTKEDYIDLRNKNVFGEILYEFYKEYFSAEKHKIFLEKDDFYKAINFWGQGNIVLPTVLSYYNNKFLITEVYNKEGVIIKLL